jgi:ABC-2 type transport system permease protein
MVIIMSASILMNSVGKEKSNQVIEVLLSSVSPRDLLVGKIIGLGILGLVQTGIWVGVSYTLLSLSGRTFSLPPGFELPPSFIAWGLTFFLLGYAVYASLMAGLGALVPNMREASQAVILVIWPLIVPLFMYVALVEQPHGALAVGLSMFPLTAPVAMMTRMAGTSVPWWQLVITVILLAGTAVLVVRSVARLFHAQTLLSGQPFSAKRFARALLGRGL